MITTMNSQYHIKFNKNTSGKIVMSIMTLELLESPELDYIHFWCIYRGGSRISGKDVYMYKGTGFAFQILSHFFLNIP